MSPLDIQLILFYILCLVSNCIHGYIDKSTIHPRNIIFSQHKITVLHESNKLSNDNNDFISRIFSRFLPTPEDVGLKRIERSSIPDTFPAVKDQFANFLSEDDMLGDFKFIRLLLAKTNLEFRELQLMYCGNKDGYNSKIFHSKVDKKGPAIVLCKTISGGLFGGYNPTGWVNYGEYRGSLAAFLFVYPNGDSKMTPIKLQKIGGAGLAQIDDGSGPKFGPEGLTIALDRSNPKLVRSKLGLYYEKLPNGKNSLLPNNSFTDELCDLKVFCGIYNKDERIPYSDAIPFAIN